MFHERTGHQRTMIAAILALIVGLPSALLGSSPATNAAAADNSANIPGVPLPGPIAAGRLGGAIYDVVYRFEVTPGHVIVASLTGADGTDFDMYLFDESATTVLSTVGLLTKSNGPTSTESISWPSRLGGTYYIDLNGATDIEGDYLLTVQTIPDPTAPVASMMLAGGRTSTSQLIVQVTLSGSDDLSGVTEMSFSADGTIFTAWQAYQPSTSWTFPAGDGLKTLWAKVKNGVGRESAVVSAVVVVDTLAPHVIALDPQPGASVIGLRPTLTVTFSESIDPASWVNLGLVVQSAGGTLVRGTYDYDEPTRRGEFIPSAPLVPGALYVVTVGNVKDVAGNGIASPGSWSVTPLTPTSLSATATQKVVLRGGSSRVDVVLSGAPRPATIGVEASTGTDGFVALPPISTDDGRNTLVVSPNSNTIYRFSYAGAFGVAPSEADVRILVRRSVVLAGRDPRLASRARVGNTVNLTAAISPAAAGASVSFRLYRFDTGRRAWVYAGSKGRSTDAAGRAVLAWVPPSSGSFYWRVSVAPTPAFANNVSPVYRWSVSR